jgi:glycosyltransferase involved in cell wall biosynthesis
MISKDGLIIASEYYSFVKDQTESLAKYFPTVNVLVRNNPFAEISSIIPINSLINFKKSHLIDRKNLPQNISVSLTPVYYAPFDFFYKRLGEQHFLAVNRVITKNNINFNLVHAHATWSSGYVGARLKERYHVPFVVTAHGYDIYSLPFKDKEWRTKIEYVLNAADHIITVSQSNLKCIQKLNVSTPVTVIPNGFRSDLFYPRDMWECRKWLNLPLNKKILLTVGNLEDVKGQSYLIEAVRMVVQERKDILCVIVGSGKLRNALIRQIHGLGLKEYVLLVGGKPHDEIPLWMNACDIFILPSLNEGNPTVLFECLGCSKPFVGTRVGGVPEVITSDDTGLLVKPANSNDLAEKILIALVKEWDQKAILAYAKQYSWENIAKEILKVYEQVLG